MKKMLTIIFLFCIVIDLSAQNFLKSEYFKLSRRNTKIKLIGKANNNYYLAFMGQKDIQLASYDNQLSFKYQIDKAVGATLTRTLYTSFTTLLPLICILIWGGSTLYWFAFSLVVGVVAGSWSSIALAPSLLSVIKEQKSTQLIEIIKDELGE